MPYDCVISILACESDIYAISYIDPYNFQSLPPLVYPVSLRIQFVFLLRRYFSLVFGRVDCVALMQFSTLFE